MTSGTASSRWGTALRLSRAPGNARRKRPIVAMTIVGLVIFASVAAKFLPLSDPVAISLQDRDLPPAPWSSGVWRHPLGTDSLGHDILSQIVFGAKDTMVSALAVIAIAAVVGTLIGMFAGLRGGVVDAIAMRTVDAFLVFPVILVALVFAVALGPSLLTTIIVISLALWARYARVIRAEVKGLAQRNFIEAARVAGRSTFFILMRHILPNVLNTVVVLSTLQVGYVITVEATLSFLGAGIPPPAPTWGGMVSGGLDALSDEWWIAVVPGIVVAAVILAFNRLGDSVRMALDPNQKSMW